MTWGQGSPEQLGADWVVPKGDDGTRVTTAFSYEGDDVVHIGLSARLTVEGGLPLPVVEKVLAACAAAMSEAIDGATFEHDGEDYRFG